MEKIEIIKSPFMCYCAKVIPLAFDESMSYYECLCNFYNYLKNEVMPTINNNAEATAELQEKVIELKDYMDHYFDSLNIQNEINNKLDDMYEHGDLSSIISQYIELQTTYGYDTVDDMKDATNLIAGCYAKTYGYNELNDGGGANYLIRTKNESDVADEVFLIDLHDETLIAELIIKNNMVNVKQSGLTGDPEDDGTSLLTLLASSGYDLFFPAGTYNTSDRLSLSSHKLIGENVNNTTIKYTAENNDLFIYYNESNDIEFNNICFDCGSADDVGKHSINFFFCNNIKLLNCEFKNGYGSHARINDCEDVLIENCYFHDIAGETGNMGNAILLHPSRNVTINKCKCTRLREDFVYLLGEEDNPVQNVLIENCLIENTSYNNDQINSYSIGINGGCLDVTVINNVINNNGNGIRCDLRNETSPNNVYIGNNIINTCIQNGIEIVGTNITIENNIIYNCAQDGVYVKDSANININNNNVHDNTRFGVWFNNVDYISVNNNRIYDNVGCGLALGRQEEQQCNHISIIGNELYQTDDGTQTTGIQMLYCNDVKVLSCKSYGQTVDYDIYRNNVTNLVSQLNPVQGASTTKSIMHSTSVPATGHYNVGDIVFFTSPSAGGYIGAVCVTAGSPGTWKNFGSISS